MVGIDGPFYAIFRTRPPLTIQGKPNLKTAKNPAKLSSII
jgi:hypothetical protein